MAHIPHWIVRTYDEDHVNDVDDVLEVGIEVDNRGDRTTGYKVNVK